MYCKTLNWFIASKSNARFWEQIHQISGNIETQNDAKCRYIDRSYLISDLLVLHKNGIQKNGWKTYRQSATYFSGPITQTTTKSYLFFRSATKTAKVQQEYKNLDSGNYQQHLRLTLCYIDPTTTLCFNGILTVFFCVFFKRWPS